MRLFDIRKFHDSRGGSSTKKSPKSLCIQTAGRSINSSFFSPSGKRLLTTSFADRVDITEDAHLHKGGVTVKPTHSIRHNNQTGKYMYLTHIVEIIFPLKGCNLCPFSF